MKCSGTCLAQHQCSCTIRSTQIDSVSQLTNSMLELFCVTPCGKEAPDVSLSPGNQYLAGIRKGFHGNKQRTCEASGTSPSPQCGHPEGQEVLGEARSASPAQPSGSQSRRKENLVFIVWLFLISFCFRDPLLRENNAFQQPGSGFLGWAPALLRGRPAPG